VLETILGMLAVNDFSRSFEIVDNDCDTALWMALGATDRISSWMLDVAAGTSLESAISLDQDVGVLTTSVTLAEELPRLRP